VTGGDPADTEYRLQVDWAGCTGHLVCVDLLPELLGVDDWGYPMVPDRPVPPRLLRHARRARAACPALALRLEERPKPAGRTGHSRP
jgi:ferredoxin